MENKELQIKILKNKLESLDNDWKENEHLFIVKRNKGNHFPTMKKLKTDLYFIGSFCLLCSIFIYSRSHSVFIFFIDLLFPAIVFGYFAYRYYQKILKYELACKEYENSREALISEIENLETEINY